MRRLHLLILILLGLFSCSESRDKGESGELGRGSFYYQCVNEINDAACAGESSPHLFPSVIAVGAWFDVTFRRDSDEEETLRVIQGSPNHVVSDGGALGMLTESYAALLAMGRDNEVVDIIHVAGRPVSALVIGNSTSS